MTIPIDPFFIVGFSRSGTTLIARIISRHPDLHVLEETHFMREYGEAEKEIDLSDNHAIASIVRSFQSIQHAGIYGNIITNVNQHKADWVLHKFKKDNQKTIARLMSILFECESREKGKTIVGDQTPNHLFYIDKLANWFPNSKFIYMLRDPRAALFSQKKKWKGAKRWGQPYFEILRTRLNYHPITQQLYWNKAVKAGEKAKRNLGKDRFLTIKFEELVQESETTVKKLCSFLNVPVSPDMLSVRVEMSADTHDEGAKGISKNVACRWQTQLSPTEIFISEKISDDYMHLFGYRRYGSQPNLFMLLFWIIIWPYQLIIAGFLNIHRFRNYLRKALSCIL